MTSDSLLLLRILGPASLPECPGWWRGEGWSLLPQGSWPQRTRVGYNLSSPDSSLPTLNSRVDLEDFRTFLEPELMQGTLGQPYVGTSGFRRSTPAHTCSPQRPAGLLAASPFVLQRAPEDQEAPPHVPGANVTPAPGENTKPTTSPCSLCYWLISISHVLFCDHGQPKAV